MPLHGRIWVPFFVSPSPFVAITIIVLLTLCHYGPLHVFPLDSESLEFKGRGKVTEIFVTPGAGHIRAEHILNIY